MEDRDKVVSRDPGKRDFLPWFLPRITIAPVQDTSKRHQGHLVQDL